MGTSLPVTLAQPADGGNGKGAGAWVGQAPSDYPEFAAFLVERGIDSISLNPDALIRTKRRIAETERSLADRPPEVIARL